MGTLAEPQDGLDLGEDVVGFIKSAPNGTDDERVIRRVPFYFPSVGTSFSRVTCTSGGETRAYFVKKFDPELYFPSEKRPILAWRRQRTRLSPPKLEHLFLEAYRTRGCSVPRSQVVDDYTLAMEDCGEETLEERLRVRTAEEQERIFASLTQEQVKFSNAGGGIEIPSEAEDRVAQYDIDIIFRNLYKYWRPAASEEETNQFMERTRFLRKYSRTQLTVGDPATFHIIFSPKRVAKWVDFEKLREWPQASELSGLYFSPESVLGFEAMERLVHSFFEAEQRPQSREEDWIRYLKDYYTSGAMECFRRGTLMRQLDMNDHHLYEQFVSRHRGFAGAFDKYKARIVEVCTKVNSNGLYTPGEKGALKTSVETVLDLMSK